MRITRLDLFRYGKFTDKSVSLPKAAKDFHLIVGPNEAGKSTLRNAILDLLFGIETRSRYNFLHPHSDMRLGAAIEQGDTALDFVRTKARSKTLQNAAGSVLPDSALAPYLGQIDRAFFDQMFGLNHDRLVQGGQDILSASNDMGQILFQAAAGVGSLGQIRDKLEAEANSLWAKRKSGDREYYAAAAELELTETALKVATVRTKDWQEANSQVSQIGTELEQARERYKEVEQTRIGLERVRRTAPMLNTLKELEQGLAELGQVASLPNDAAGLLTQAEHDIAVATQSAQLYEGQHTELSEKLKTVTRSQERRNALLEQKVGAQSSVTDLTSRKAQAQSAVTNWQADFEKHLALAHLPNSTQVEAAQEALGLIDRIQVLLQKIRDIRINRIEAMRLALKDFEQQAQTLANAIAPDLAKEPASHIALTLSHRLKEAQSLSQEERRLKLEIEIVASKVGEAKVQMASAHASLKPLLNLAAAPDNDSLRVAIGNSDRFRSLTLEVEQATKQLAGVADGLARNVLETEFSAADLSAIPIQLAELKEQIGVIVDKQNALSGALNAAQTNLEKIAGQADAARAESQRQEALARMVNAVDRFIKVHTAAKLLRWSIDRFRESKQGPMLSRASDVFKQLTQGAFCKLAVDYESEPLKLSGQRDSGELVDIEGLSDGTRDQLYLALRLSALELHLQKTMPLPFIADDLFINYDDGRAMAGLQALAHLSEATQVIFLTHHEHLVPVAQSVFGDRLNVVNLG